jgi:hypothetical protein
LLRLQVEKPDDPLLAVFQKRKKGLEFEKRLKLPLYPLEPERILSLHLLKPQHDKVLSI